MQKWQHILFQEGRWGKGTKPIPLLDMVRFGTEFSHCCNKHTRMPCHSSYTRMWKLPCAIALAMHGAQSQLLTCICTLQKKEKHVFAKMLHNSTWKDNYLYTVSFFGNNFFFCGKTGNKLKMKTGGSSLETQNWEGNAISIPHQATPLIQSM